MTEKEALKARHSVRSYSDQPISSENQMALERIIRSANEEGNLHFQFQKKAGNAFNRFLTKVMGLATAPSLIACIGYNDDTLEERVGYYGQKIVLFAQSIGLNTCWAGTFRKDGVTAEIDNNERLVLVIAVGYGTTQGKPRRSKTPEQVAVCTGPMPESFLSGIRAALLAPTAINQQRFEIRLLDDGSVEFQDKGGPFSKVDLGIVRYNFEVGCDRAFRCKP